MSKIPVVYLNFNPEASADEYWDQSLVNDVIFGRAWKPAQGYEFMSITPTPVVTQDPELYSTDYFVDFYNISRDTKGAVLIIPARHNARYISEIQQVISRLEWCVLILTGDEERDFDYTKLKHSNMKVWLMQPKPDDEADFYLGSGYSPYARNSLMKDGDFYLSKPLDWYFSGQDNHDRRWQSTKVLDHMLAEPTTRGIVIKGFLTTTSGFTQGDEPSEYFLRMASSKALPSPSGVKSPDSFRLYEALESGGVPVADELSELYQEPGYWQKVFGEGVPFKVLNDYANLQGYISDVVEEYPILQNKVFAWWQQYKRKMVYTLNEHIHELSGLPYEDFGLRSEITVIIPTSVIPSHPETTVLDTTIESIRQQLPDCEIILCFDKIRPEQEMENERYQKYIQRVLWKCNFDPIYSNVMPIVAEEFSHQVRLTRKALEYVKTPTILFVEHDTPIYGDREFEWRSLVAAILTGEAYAIRLHHEAQILDVHRHLMLDEEPQFVCGAPMMRTSQWSSRPHLASTVWYRKMLNEYFTEGATTFTEDKLYGAVSEDVKLNGEMGWYNWRLWIYSPDGDMKRSYTTDGRQGALKYDDQLIF